jgi:hypothetical protein
MFNLGIYLINTKQTHTFDTKKHNIMSGYGFRQSYTWMSPQNYHRNDGRIASITEDASMIRSRGIMLVYHSE